MSWSDGDTEVAPRNEILRIRVGSELFGTSVGASDQDLIAVYVNTPAQLLGFAKNQEHWTYRTQPEGVRSGPGDTDLISYSLKKFVKLAMKGNPSIILPLFAPDEFIVDVSPPGDALRFLVPLLLQKNQITSFVYYFKEQVRRLRGSGGQGRMPSRPELVEKYGYDSKYASVAARIALCGTELATTGTVKLPLNEAKRTLCTDIRQGKYTLDEVNTILDDIGDDLTRANESGNVLPDEIDTDYVNDWLIDAHFIYWRDHGHFI